MWGRATSTARDGVGCGAGAGDAPRRPPDQSLCQGSHRRRSHRPHPTDRARLATIVIAALALGLLLCWKIQEPVLVALGATAGIATHWPWRPPSPTIHTGASHEM